MAFFIAASVSAVGSLILILVARGQKAKASAIAGTETSTAAELRKEAADIAAEIGAGAFSKQVELKGVVDAASPLTAEMSGKPCVHFRSVVTREYEETYSETDKDGHRRTGTRRGSEEVSRIERFTRFELRDETGAIEVDPTGSKPDEEQILSRFEPAQSMGVTVGSFRLDFGALAALGGGRRTIGYKLEEWALPVGARVYFLGEASDAEGRLLARKPGAKGGRFIISMKSEEELLRRSGSLATTLTIIASILGAGSLVLVILGFLGIAA